jgi:hypothetical protein
MHVVFNVRSIVSKETDCRRQYLIVHLCAGAVGSGLELNKANALMYYVGSTKIAMHRASKNIRYNYPINIDNTSNINNKNLMASCLLLVYPS